MNTEITIALIGGGVTLLSIIIQQIIKIKGLKRQNNQAKAEISFSHSAFDFAKFVGEWADIHSEIIDLINTTNVDRFLILRAWNGIDTPKWTTAVLQIRESGQTPIQYIHFELDGDYVSRLNELTRFKNAYYEVANMPTSEIKKVYEAEEVTASLWSFLDKKEYQKGLHALTYCSFSTHSDKLLSQREITRCKIIAGRLKGASRMFN